MPICWKDVRKVLVIAASILTGAATPAGSPARAQSDASPVGTFWAGERAVPITSPTTSYTIGEKVACDSLRSLA